MQSSYQPLLTLRCLNGNDVVTSRISDHHPLIHDGVLFWNVMMQAKKRISTMPHSYNNGHGMVENEADYCKRLRMIARVTAEIVHRYPEIEHICFCEGPVQALHQQVLFQALSNHPWLNKFFKNLIMKNNWHQPHQKEFPNWGLIMLSEKNYQSKRITCEIVQNSPYFSAVLTNRLQIWQLKKAGKIKYLALGHFPFGDEQVMTKAALSFAGKKYCELINHLLTQYANEEFVFCADFNLNPYLISSRYERELDQIPDDNSILFKPGKMTTMTVPTQTQPVTVDGILLSKYEKQKYLSLHTQLNLFSYHKRERDLWQAANKTPSSAADDCAWLVRRVGAKSMK